MPEPQNPENPQDHIDETGGVRATGASAAAPTAAEWAEMHTRVIALETLVVALLASASDVQRGLAREMAEMITPRPGATPHPLTVHAAHRMSDLIDRARRHDAARS